MKEVYRAQSIADADVVSSMLHAHGVQTFIPDRNIATSYPALMVYSGVRLLVADDDFSLAQKLVQELAGAPESSSADEDTSPA